MSLDSEVYLWSPEGPRLGSVVVALGVFDGVHLGHQSLIAAAARDAADRSLPMVAVTFDRDPDQIVAPSAAAPQLLTLEDKCDFLLGAGASAVLVIPFTSELAETTAEAFLESVLYVACRPVSLHVGVDFRFGARALGDIHLLAEWAHAHDGTVVAHELVCRDGEPVTSTRIRRLVAEGDVVAARELLTRPHRLRGLVHHGRGEGARLGFPTANVVYEPFSARPGDGVYAGWATPCGGTRQMAALSLGIPPMFPEARDNVEVHLLDFEGDLYDRELLLEFVELIRPLRAFPSREVLVAAIAHDVGTARHILEWSETPVDADLIADPAALESAERAVASINPFDSYSAIDEEWTVAVGPQHISGLFADAGFSAALLSAPLTAAGIPCAWDPYPPEEMPGYRFGYGAVDRQFSLLVPSSQLEEAMAILAQAYNW